MKKPFITPLLPLIVVSAAVGLVLGVRYLCRGEVLLGAFLLLFCLAQSFVAFLIRHLAVIAATPGFKGDRWFKFVPDPKGPIDAA